MTERHTNNHKFQPKAKIVKHCPTFRSVLETVLECLDELLSTMSLLEGGCSRLAGKYLDIRSSAMTRLVKMRHAAKEMTDTEVRAAIQQILKCKMLVAKLRG